MGQNLLLDAMNHELASASPDLVGNGDLLRGILAGCGDCIKILDLDGRLQFMSEGGKRVMEVDDFAALKGCPWPDFWVGEGNAQAHAAMASAKAGRTARFQNAAKTARGTPRYWDVQVSPIVDSDGKISHLLSISRDISIERETALIQEKSVERQLFLTEELTHRVKNTLATVLAIANQTFLGDAHKEPREVFSARIRTLGDAYAILTESNWLSGSINRVVNSALAPYQTGRGQIFVSGPEHELSPHQSLTLALTLNELSTNAMKYGALSVPGGRIDVSWAITRAESGSAFQFDWRESAGPTVVPPTRSGFGSRLIKTLLPGDFGGSVDVLYEPSGLVFSLRAPA